MKSTMHILRDVDRPLNSPEFAGLSFRQMQELPALAHGLGAFTTVRTHANGQIYCGTTALDNDILYRFDPESKELECLEYQAVSERYEVKVHRSLEVDVDGRIFGATAGLHDPSERAHAPGGSIFVFDPKTKKIEKLGIPVEKEYVQSIVLDRKRRKICGCTYPIPYFFCFDVSSNETVCRHYIGSMPHLLGIDDNGFTWGTWGESNQRNLLFSYDLDNDQMHFTRVVLPGLERSDDGALDGIVNGGDGFMYLGTVQGALLRLDPSNVEAPGLEFLGKPLPKWRMPALVVVDDDLLYMVAGGEYDVHIVSYSRRERRFSDLGKIVDEGSGEACYMPHDLAVVPGGKVYVGETDHPARSGYLWECAL